MKVQKLMTCLAVMAFAALGFSANAQSFTVDVTNNTDCNMTVAILGSSQLSPCSNNLGEGQTVIPPNSTATVTFLDTKGRPVQAFLTAGGAMATDNNGVAQGTGASLDLCTSNSVTGAGLACVGFNVTIVGQTMTID